MIYLQLLCIQLVTVFIVDLSGVVETIKRAIWRIAKGKTVSYCDFSLKPLDCSLCLTFWASLIFSICAGAFSLPVLLYVCVLAYLTPLALSAMRISRDALASILNKLSDILEPR